MRRSAALVAFAVGVLVSAPTAPAVGAVSPSAGDRAVRPLQTDATPAAQQQSGAATTGAQVAAGLSELIGQSVTLQQGTLQGGPATQTQTTTGTTSDQGAAVAATDPLAAAAPAAGGGGGKDPCSGPHPDPSCSQAPETPFSLLYLAAAAAALAVYYLVERHRRRTRAIAG